MGTRSFVPRSRVASTTRVASNRRRRRRRASSSACDVEVERGAAWVVVCVSLSLYIFSRWVYWVLYMYHLSVCVEGWMDVVPCASSGHMHVRVRASTDRAMGSMRTIDRGDRVIDRSIVRSFASIAPSMNARDARVRVHAPDRSRHQSTHSSNRASMAFSVTLYPHPGLFHAIFMTPRGCLEDHRSMDVHR